MLPALTPQVLEFLFPGAAPRRDWEVTHDPGKRDAGGAILREPRTTISAWRRAEPRPTDEAILAAAASSEFAAWLAERNDPALVRRREAKEQLASGAPQQVAQNALAAALLDRVNECRTALGLARVELADVLSAGVRKVDSASVKLVAASAAIE